MSILKKILLTLLLVMSFSTILLSQKMTEEKKAEYIGYLNGTNYSTVLGMLELLSDSNIVEAIPVMVSNLWRYEPSLREECLLALYKLNYAETHVLTLDYYDSLSVGRADRLFSKLELQCSGNYILFPLGDFSKRQYVFDYVRSISPEVDHDEIYLLEEIVKNVPTDSQVVKNELIKIALNSSNHMSRWIATKVLKDHYVIQAIESIIKVFENDDDWSNRGLIISEVFKKYKSNEIHNSLLKQINKEENEQNLSEMSGELLRKYKLPADLFAVQAVYSQIVDTVFKESVMYLLKDFYPGTLMVNSTRMENIDTLISYHSQCTSFNWLGNTTFPEQLRTFLQDAKGKLTNNDSLGTAIKIKQYQSLINQAYKDSTSERYVTSDGYKFLYYYPQYILERLPKIPTVKLESSTGALLPKGNLQYYEGGWKDAIDNGDGTFSVDTKQKTVSLRMNYAYGSQTKSNITVGTDTVVFQTVNAKVQLQNSLGAALDTGKVQYYAGAWREFGATTNGTASKELLPGNYSFRMSYAYASTDKQQDLKTNPIVIFQTVNASVQLQNSSGNLIDQGTVQYYSGAWRDFGTTANGVASKELLPNNYSFRMTYAYASTDKQQDLKTNPTVVFQTVNAQVQLKNSLGNLIDQGTVQYYSGAWREFGATANGIASKELLPNNYSFRITYAYASIDRQQDLKTNSTVVFQTVNAEVQLKNSLGNLIDQGTVQYYSGAWRDFGITTNGIATKELLPNNYSFRMTYAYASTDKQQDLKTNPTVVFQTVNAQVQLKNSLGNLIDQGTVQYYSGAWRDFGTTANGTATKELLPNNYSFRMTHEYISKDKNQNVGTNNIVNFSTVLCTIHVKDTQNNPVSNAAVSYYSGAWRQIGLTVNGEITKELLPANITFRVNYNSTQKDKAQDITTNNIVEFAF